MFKLFSQFSNVYRIITKSNNIKKPYRKFSDKIFLGGDKRGRTAGLLNAIQALYRLSYTPVNCAIKAQSFL